MRALKGREHVEQEWPMGLVVILIILILLLLAGFLPGGPTLRHLLALLAGFREPDSESPMAIACFRLFTVPPLPPLPLFSVPFLRRRMALFTSFLALREYFAIATSSWLPVGNAARLNLLRIRDGSTCSHRDIPLSGA